MTTASTTAAPAARGLLGKTILGRYRVLRHLADGGMGAIYLARNEGAAGFLRPVVVKVLLPTLIADERMIDMFMREARIMANLRHPSIVSVLDFAQDADMHVMVLDYVHGFHLGRWLRYVSKTRGPFPVEVACHVVLQVLRALHYAHTMKGPDGAPLHIVHRDVTPSNILIDVEGHTKLADFGIARMNTDKTEAGKHAIKGKFPYLAPELLEGAEPSAQTDVYSVGVTLHEVLRGRNEFRAQNLPAIISRVLKHEVTRLSELRDDCPEALCDVIARAVAKRPEDRFATAAQFAEALVATRALTEDEAARRLAELAGEDFRDPRMAEMLAVPALDDLESSWQTPTPSAIDHDPDLGVARPGDGARAEPGEDTIAGQSIDITVEAPVAPELHADKTVALGRRGGDAGADRTPAAGADPALDRTAPGPPAPAATSAPATPAEAAGAASAPASPRRAPWAMLGLAAGLVGVGAIAIAALLRGGEPAREDPAYVVVDDRARPAAAADAAPPSAAERLPDAAVAAAPPDAAPAAPAGDPDDAPPRDRRGGRPGPADRPRDPAGAQDTVRDLTRAFEQQKGRVQACFDRHAGDASGASELAVRFRVDTTGKVASAELVPDALASTSLGGCLLGVARATTFPALAEPITFRVPLRARIK